MYKLTYHLDQNYNSSFDIDVPELRKNRFVDFRKKYKIPFDGTCVSFGIPSTVTFSKNIKNNLKSLIESYPFFKYLLNQQNREVILVQNGNETKLSSSKYCFDKKEKVYSEKFTYNFENKNIECELSLFINDKEIDTTHILVRDENFTIYDNTLFDFTNEAAAQNISGELIIKGLYKICSDKLNDKNNPIAIVHDNRTGFDTKTPFYLGLNNLLWPIIDKVLRKFVNNTNQIDLTNDEKISNGLREINKYINSELKETIGGNIKGLTPPPEGIKFVRQNVTITQDKTYDLKLLVNTNLVLPNDTIKFIIESNNSIETSPEEITIHPDEINDSSLVIKNLTIKALKLTSVPIKIEAICKSYKTFSFINVKSIDIHYPTNGLEFFKHKLELTYNVQHCCKLYFDTEVVPIGAKITLSTKPLGGIELKQTKIGITSNLLFPNSTIGVIDVISTGGNLNNEYSIVASFENISTKVSISLVESALQWFPPGGGLVSGIIIEGSDAPHQTFYNPSTHNIFINSKNIINKTIIEKIENFALNPGGSNFSRLFDKEAAKYISDLVVAEVARLIVKTQNVRKGEFGMSNDDIEGFIDEYNNAIQKHKNKLFNLFYKKLHPDR